MYVAIGSAALTALALLAAYMEEIRVSLGRLEPDKAVLYATQPLAEFIQQFKITLLNPQVLAGVFIGAMGTLIGTQIADLLANSETYISDTVDTINDWFGTEIDAEQVIADGAADMVGMTRALAREFGDRGIRVNCVSPGTMNTTRAAGRAPRPDATKVVPLGRPGEAGEIATTVRFLCGPGANFITGQTVHVNGGQMMF